ncbi:MAG: hypothetical protein JRN68_02415 [Nitrososphaerota archaeon]|jgi:hypothetical protein|nr:hypothetical protein [Nitrososphaerota archaeon]
MHDTKTNRPFAEVVRGFKFQASPSACYTVSIHNILEELASRHERNDIRLSEKRINEITKFRDLIGPRLEVVVSNLRSVISKYGYFPYEKFNAKYDNVLKVLKDQECSYPLVGLAYSYLRRERGMFTNDVPPENPPDHVVILLLLNKDDAVLYDPYGKFSRTRSNDGTLPEGVFRLPTSRFLDVYWHGASEPSWFFYIERKGGHREGLDTYINN